MYLLVSGATNTVNKLIENEYLGKYVIPQNTYEKYLDEVKRQNCVFGADNGCFNQLDEIKFMKMIEILKEKDIKRLKYVTVPDIVCNHEETLKLFNVWYEKLKDFNLPLAFVIQNGCKIDEIPFDKISSIFIGGCTEYKLGKEVEEIVKVAKLKNKWVHMGRVNSETRIIYAYKIGCDSIDGTGFSMFPKKNIPWALNLLERLDIESGVLDKDIKEIIIKKTGDYQLMFNFG